MLKNGDRRPVWVYPKVAGFNPPERWGHSACYHDGILYIFGGCCGGLHFSDVVTLDFKTMEWISLETSGLQPGTRDSHSAVVWGDKMVIFGGTNGSKKINDLHFLDLRTREWSQPDIQGKPPSARESHSATLIGDSKLVIFGGSGEGEGNYLNDVHILDLEAMEWSSPEVKGELPARRDSHTAVAIENRLVVYGGDCGDHYLGEVDILDLATFTWSRLAVQGSSSPGIRAGHATVSICSKVYVIGGVGDRAYYNDIWMLDVNNCTWMQLEVGGQQPQGRFSHTAVHADSDIAIYGGCGEDERPLDEIIILQFEVERANGLYGFLRDRNLRFSGLLKSVAEDNGWIPEKRPENSGRETKSSETWKDDLNVKYMKFVDAEAESKTYSSINPENPQPKRRKKVHSGRPEFEPEQDEHSHSLSQHSSPSQQSDFQEQMLLKKTCNGPISGAPQPFGIFVQQTPQNQQRQQQYGMQHQHHRPPHVNAQLQDLKLEQQQQQQHFVRLPPAVQLHVRVPHQTMTLPANNVSLTPPMQSFPRENSSTVHDRSARDFQTRLPEVQSVADQPQKPSVIAVPNLIGAEVRGTVDAAFDSGYLMTAQVNGQLFRGLLFSPGPAVVAREPSMPSSHIVNGNGNTGIVLAHPVGQPQTVQHCLNGAFGGLPIMPNMQIGTIIQPANLARTVPISAAESRGDCGPNIVIKTTAFPALQDVQRPNQDARCSYRPPNFGGFAPSSPSSNLGNARRKDDDAQPRQPKAEPGTVSGNVQSVMGGHWVWQPLHPGHQRTSVQDYQSAFPRKENMHFVAVPPFPGISCMPPQQSNEARASAVLAGSVHVGQHAGNGTTVADLQGITLRLGAPGQVGGQKH